MDTLQGVLLVTTAASASLYVTMVSGYLVGMRHKETSRPSARPRVSILKPLAGSDDELLQNLESFAELAYPDFEILLGVGSTSDPAYAVARRFVETTGRSHARLIVTNPDEARNPKVAQLLCLERAASGTVLVVADSNVRVTPNYLEPLLADLHQPGVALTSSLIAGTGEQSLGAALENLQLGALVAPSVVSAAYLTGQILTVGKSMAMWRDALVDIGGFARVQNLLSEDHMLGKAFVQAGYRVRVSLTPVSNRNVDCSLLRTVERHTRWAKLRRSICPAAFAGEPLLMPLVVATIAFAIAPSRALCLALFAAIVLQMVSAIVMTRVLRGTAPRWYWAPLEIVRSYVLLLCWFRACLSRRVAWRGHEFELGRDSLIVPAEPSVWARFRTMTRA